MFAHITNTPLSAVELMWMDDFLLYEKAADRVMRHLHSKLQ